MDSSNGISCTTGGSINIMTHVKGHKKKKVIDASQFDPKKTKFAKVSKKEVGKVEAIQAATETRARFGAAKGRGQSAKEALEGKKQTKAALGKQFIITEEAPPQTLNPLDILAAPLSKPGTFFTEGPIAGGLAVKASREKIAAGDISEAGSVILTTATTTGLLAGAILAGTGAVGTVVALNAKLAATTGLQAATAATIATKAGLVGGVGLGIIFGIDKFVFSPGELGTWAAVDNVAGALSFQISELDNGVRAGTTTPAEAAIIIAETESTINTMRNYIITQVERNPKLWASGKIFNEALDTAEARVQQISLQIFGTTQEE